MAGEFFQRYLPDPRLFRGYKSIQDAIDVYKAARLPHIAARLEAELAALMVATERQTIEDAAIGTKIIRETLDRRIVRDNGGHETVFSAASGRHLADTVHSIPLPTELPAGALGYGAVDQLNQAVDPDYPQSPYWRAIEYGSSAAVGRILVGYFQPGMAAPSQAEFRNHPYFQSTPGTPGAPAMKVARPIEAKHFLRDGSHEAVAQHEGQMQRLQGEAIDAMLASTAAPRTR